MKWIHSQIAILNSNLETASESFVEQFSVYDDTDLRNFYKLPYIKKDESRKNCVRIEKIPIFNNARINWGGQSGGFLAHLSQRLTRSAYSIPMVRRRPHFQT